MITIDFFTMTINNPEILEKTYEYFYKNIKGWNLKDSTLYLNVDPHPDEINLNNMKKIGEKYFKNVVFNVPNCCNCSAAFKWGISSFKSDYLFILEANKCISKEFNILEMIQKFDINSNIVEVCLSPKRDNPLLKYLTSHPSIWKKEWLKQIEKLLSPNINYEYQLRELALLFNKVGYTLANPNNIYLLHIGKNYKEERKYLLANSSTDDEIINIIYKEGEWHQYILDHIENMCEANNKITDSNFQPNLENLKQFKKKLNDKDWQYRWIGVWKYVKNDNYYIRHLKKSNMYMCNK
jgi:hypothetical protein